MEVKIYQINTDRDKNNVVFESLDFFTRGPGDSPDIDASLYDVVFEGEVDARDLEDVYRIFNVEHPEGYKGRSLSVSDVVEVISADDINPGHYFCDSIGFKQIAFKA